MKIVVALALNVWKKTKTVIVSVKRVRSRLTTNVIVMRQGLIAVLDDCSCPKCGECTVYNGDKERM
jgi:hypothetical protein